MDYLPTAIEDGPDMSKYDGTYEESDELKGETVNDDFQNASPDESKNATFELADISGQHTSLDDDDHLTATDISESTNIVSENDDGHLIVPHDKSPRFDSTDDIFQDLMSVANDSSHLLKNDSHHLTSDVGNENEDVGDLNENVLDPPPAIIIDKSEDQHSAHIDDNFGNSYGMQDNELNLPFDTSFNDPLTFDNVPENSLENNIENDVQNTNFEDIQDSKIIDLPADAQIVELAGNVEVESDAEKPRSGDQFLIDNSGERKHAATENISSIETSPQTRNRNEPSDFEEVSEPPKSPEEIQESINDKMSPDIHETNESNREVSFSADQIFTIAAENIDDEHVDEDKNEPCTEDDKSENENNMPSRSHSEAERQEDSVVDEFHEQSHNSRDKFDNLGVVSSQDSTDQLLKSQAKNSKDEDETADVVAPEEHDQVPKQDSQLDIADDDNVKNIEVDMNEQLVKAHIEKPPEYKTNKKAPVGKQRLKTSNETQLQVDIQATEDSRSYEFFMPGPEGSEETTLIEQQSPDLRITIDEEKSLASLSREEVEKLAIKNMKKRRQWVITAILLGICALALACTTAILAFNFTTLKEKCGDPSVGF